MMILLEDRDYVNNVVLETHRLPKVFISVCHTGVYVVQARRAINPYKSFLLASWRKVYSVMKFRPLPLLNSICTSPLIPMLLEGIYFALIELQWN